MDRPITAGVAGGSASALLWRLVAELAAPRAVPLLDCPLCDCDCPAFPGIDLGSLDGFSLLAGACMSSGDGVVDWDLAELREEIVHLCCQVRALEQRLSALESRTPSSTSPAAASSSYTGAGYRVGLAREEVCQSLGLWLRRGIEGREQGPSDRDRLALKSHYYLVAKDYEGVLFDPPLLFSTWRDCERVVRRDRRFGPSIFLGLPSKTEVSSGTPFATFLRSLTSTPSADEGTASPIWPMPMPYPRWTLKETGKPMSYQRMCEEKVLNLQVAYLSWLHLGKPERAPSSMSTGKSLNAKQWAVVRRFEMQLKDLAKNEDYGPSNIGRTAAKVESLAFLLEELREKTSQLLSPYEHRPVAQGDPERKLLRGHELGDPGEVIGHLAQGTLQTAKCVEPSRLSFPKEAPTFDATEYFDEPHRSMFVDPISQRIDPTCLMEEPPRVRIHASKQQALDLFKFLDSHHRLRLVPEEKVEKKFLCGAFSLIKDENKDRLIMDARPPNLLENTLGTWSKTLGAISAVLQIELLPGQKLLMSGTDLQDYYYCFKVSRARASRNTFNYPLTTKAARAFNCFHPSMEKYPILYPCLSTMAMGDCQSPNVMT
eukprot:Skav205535  [mRNA]  locus=scaffold1012:177:4000:- [translate_table: standard]